ncbi:hypothetical protein [Rhodoferax aquaticus]|uniref:Uncharacterized protein n=1 Tax=Rhodoferax aquaticus TaxID=2527691 RepID=A0A515ESB8_9BURK|nr:hypothetical protein [Rhodoferax aquaticus]QDL55503.1 hypothetical protein EXZ61_15720 [Rhodoferax aquaticus]
MSKERKNAAVANRQVCIDAVVSLASDLDKVDQEIVDLNLSLREIESALRESLIDIPDPQPSLEAYRRGLALFEIGKCTTQELQALEAERNAVQTKKDEIERNNFSATERCNDSIAGLKKLIRESEIRRESIAAELRSKKIAFLHSEAACIGFDYVEQADALSESFKKLSGLERILAATTGNFQKQHVILFAKDDFCVPIFKGPAFEGRAIPFNQWLLHSARADTFGGASEIAMAKLIEEFKAVNVTI